MKLSFDKFERYEMPQVTLCNPNSRATEVDEKITITDTVGMLSNLSGMNLKLNFNAPHELSFDYYRHKSSNPIKQSFYDNIYESIQTDRYIYLTDIGYFIISNVSDSDEDNIDRKSITCKSCEENEFAIAEGLYLKEGTYYLQTEDNQGLLDLFLPKTLGWTIGYIDPSLLNKPYYVEETEVDNGYNFLYTTVQDMFECIVEPDIIKRTISVYSRVYYAERHLTDIHIAKYNLLKHRTVEENDEDKYTALNVQGKDENLEIRTVNPSGTNVIYNFEPRYSWMSPALQVAITKWQEKCESVEGEYLTLQQGYYNDMQNIVFPLEKDIEVFELELKEKEQTRDAIVYGEYDEEKYDEIQENALKEVNDEIKDVTEKINTAKENLAIAKDNIQNNYSQPLSQINIDCALNTTAVDINGDAIFTADLLNELMTHIKTTDYVDEYMLVTESMTYLQRFEKAKELMDRAQSQLVKISSGQKTYSIDTRSFLFNKQFRYFSEQLCAGAIIYVESKNDTMEQLHLTGIDINFDEKSTSFTLGNKYDRSDLKALYDDALGQNSKSFTELKYIASIVEEQRKYSQRDWAAELRTLTLENVLISEDQSIEINNRGLIGRKRQVNEDGSWKTDENGNPLFNPEQVKLINNTLVFTNDNWNTAATAVGKIAVGYNSDGSIKYSYGINGQVLIGELILGNNLVLTGTGAGIKIKDSNGDDAFYADENGNLVLSGTIYANSGRIGGWTLTNEELLGGNAKTSTKSGMGINNYLFVGAGKYQRPGYELGSNELGEFPFQTAQELGINPENTYYRTNELTGESEYSTDNIHWYRFYEDPTSASTNIKPDGGILTNKLKVGRTRPSTISSPEDSGNFELDVRFPNLVYNPDTCTLSINRGMTKQSDGSYAWNPDTNVLTVDRDGLKIKGVVYASKGEIGGWTLTATKIYGGDDGSSEYGTGDGVNKGIACVQLPNSNNSGSRTVFAAGKGGSHSSYAGCEFRVTQDGTLTATKGKIGNWTIKDLNSANVAERGAFIYGDYSATTGFMALRPMASLVDPHSGDTSIGNSYDYAPIAYANIHHADYRFIVDIHGNVDCHVVNADVVVTPVGTDLNSDVNIKNSIETFPIEYEVLFDNLKPCRFKYNYGNSDRYHTGFIAQEVSAGLDEAGLTSQDFAALVHLDSPIQGSEWQLRKDEFVALNTWQIQKLKNKVAELENIISQLQQNLTAG